MSVVLTDSNLELPTYPHENNLIDQSLNKGVLYEIYLPTQHSSSTAACPQQEIRTILHNLKNYLLNPALIQQVQKPFRFNCEKR